MDQDETWDVDTGDEGDVNFFYTLLHELGHSLGLGHSSKQESIMYPWYSSKRTEQDLYEDDIIGIEQLYGRKEGRSRFGPISTQPRQTTTRRTTTTRPRQPSNEIEPKYSPAPDSCKQGFDGIDAIGNIRGETMIFKGAWLWRFHQGRLLPGSPTEFHRMFKGLSRFDRIDAVFERKDAKFVFFSGQEVIVHNGFDVVHVYNLDYLGIYGVRKIDAIFKWGYNNKTYIFSGNNFWRLVLPR